MSISEEKARRLEQAARLYYEETKTQQEISVKLGVSRPMVSKLLKQARDLGIVEIRIKTAGGREDGLIERLARMFGLKGGLLTAEAGDNQTTNHRLAEAALKYIEELGGGLLGLGWGHIIGAMVSLLEAGRPKASAVSDVCPMVGNSGISIRNYHSNENVRLVAQQTESVPHYLHTPAFAETRREMELLEQTEHYLAIRRLWEKLDVALVNIGNHPSTPDFASQARYGALLAERQAVGRLIAYYFNGRGEIIHSDFDYAIQIPLPLLQQSRNVVGICSANTHWAALGGALRTGLLTHLIAPESLVRRLLSEPQ
ncbi:hypothetical protein LJB99_05500 [Deltaproteobacteria bacterium OttesenSCG-928-K17]|nr:hypothetical protein [Deltaproteobacteria bacterium OttesenSCG-928-K17]